MSKLVVARYYVPSAEEQRAVQQKIALVLQMLQRCVALREALLRFEEVEGEDLAATLVRYQQASEERRWDDFVGDYNRLYETLPAVEARLEERVAAAKGRRLRLELTASTLAASTASPAERAMLEKIARESQQMRSDSLDEASSKIEAALARLLEAPPTGRAATSTPVQLDLARSLMYPGATHPESIRVSPPIPAAGAESDTRINRLITQLSALEDDTGDYIQRAREVALEQDNSRRSLLLNSLVIEVAECVGARRTTRESSRLIGEAIADLTPFDGPEVEALRQRLAAAQEESNLGHARALAAEARSFADAEAKRRDGLLVRAAIVKGLCDLGYEVRLQGDTWDERGQLEIARPGEPNYDVHLSAAANGRVQSKVRAFAHAGRSEGVNRRDVEVEQGWCDDLKKLNSLIEAQGFAAEIVHEEGPGSAAQKPLPGRSDGRDRPMTPQPRTRILPS